MGLRRNPEAAGWVAGVVLTAVGVLLTLLPTLLGMDMMGGGYALLLVGFFVILMGMITTGMFLYRAARLQAILAGKNLLAHWVYDPDQARDQAQKDLQDTRARNRALFLVMAFFLLACVVLFTAIGVLSGEGDNMPTFIGLMLGVLALLAAFAFGMPGVQHRRAMRSSHEAYIATNGLYLNGALHTWNAPLAGLDDVSYVEDGHGVRLVFHLRSLTRVGWVRYEPYSVEVPVPRGEEGAAREVAQLLG